MEEAVQMKREFGGEEKSRDRFPLAGNNLVAQ
jgi:hypothetical protein